jgi:putative ABC transport system ATP-binding protein
MMKTILETRSVSKLYGHGSNTIKAVEEVSIEVHSGEFIALVGPSGSGKTTMLAMLAGLLRSSSGDLTIDGHDLVRMSDRELTQFRREKIGFTFQANNLIPYLTALENVALMLKLNGKSHKQARSQAEELLSRLGLGDRLSNLPGQLSGGQQQRVAIARALVHDPSLVLADEPTASLDTERAFQVVEIFADLIHEKQKAGIMVTHDLRMCRYVDKVIQMVDGKVVRVLVDPAQIAALGNSGLSNPSYVQEQIQTDPVRAFPVASPAFAMGD